MLAALNLSSNNLARINTTHFSNLKTSSLDLSNNQILIIENNSFIKLEWLFTLYLRNNSIETIQSNMVNIKSLKTIFDSDKS
jgi:Leucine-rich repeat (LRR) protein